MRADSGIHRPCSRGAAGLAALHRRRRRRCRCREELVKLLSSQPWADKTHRYFLNREEEYVGGLKTAVGIW